MSEQSTQQTLNLSMSSAGDFPVKTSQWPGSARAWLESGQGYGSSFIEFLQELSRVTALSKTYRGFYLDADVFSALRWPETSQSTPDGDGATENVRFALAAARGETYLALIADVISHSSSPDWSNSAIASRSGLLMLNISDSPNDASVCSLSEVLETEVARGILRRAEKRGRELPPVLMEALTQIAKQNTAD